VLDLILSIPVSAASLSISAIGTFIVFVYVWLPYMILPTQAALERVPGNRCSRPRPISARPRPDLPLGDPAAGAARHRRRLDLHLLADAGRLHHPADRRHSTLFIGQAVYTLQGTAGNIPLAAAFSVVPIVIMAIYLTIAKRMGAFDAL
jgi:putative spermidine/putrescine transport system permease protein